LEPFHKEVTVLEVSDTPETTGTPDQKTAPPSPRRRIPNWKYQIPLVSY